MPTRSKKSSKSKSNVDKRQDKQIANLRKMVVGEKPRVEDIYTVSEQQLPNKLQLTNLINYDNTINKLGSTVVSRSVFRLNNKIYIRGTQDPTAQSALNTHRPIRVIYFLWKCDVNPGVVSGFNVVEPGAADLFDDWSATNVDLTLQRLSYKNRKRIRVLKDTLRSLTNHSGTENDFMVQFNQTSKYGITYKYPTQDQSGPATMWLPFVLIIDPIAAAAHRCTYAMKTHCLFTEETS